ncbi:MAG TPA: acyl-ACP--UDP-N-acetylglucosamine O-acyltransferase [Gammaproteobacteria bacterium]
MIDPRAIVDPGAILGEGVSIGPFSIIGPEVEIGDRCWIGPHVTLSGPCRLGADNKVYQFASVGEAPQDKSFSGQPTRLEIGDRNIIREYATLNRGTVKGGGVTRVGDDNLIMAYCHIAHDCIIGDNTIFANAASLAGHVLVGDYAYLSGFVIVHQFCQIGAHAFCSMGSAISKDVPPYVTVAGHPARPYGINAEGLRRRGFAAERIRRIRDHYKTLYKAGLRLEAAVEKLREQAAGGCADAALLAGFIEGSKRSIIR